jgi:hypothetical protein
MLTEIGMNYLEFRQLYNAYRHGYRVFFGENSNTANDIFAFIDNDGKQMFTEIDSKKLERLFTLSEYCRKILEHMIKQHRIRTDYESKGGGKQKVNTIFIFRGDEERPTKDDLYILYPNRGERLKRERTEAENIYNIFKERLEIEDKGKIVAIDLDSKKILAKDYDLNRVLSHVRDAGSSGRVHLRRISENGKIGIEIY